MALEAFDWVSWGNPVALWWLMLCVAAGVNLGLLAWTWRRLGGDRQWPVRLVLILATVYTLVCAFRGILPRADVQRIVLFDTWWSSVLVGRSVATVAELAFVLQWALVLLFAGRMWGSRPIQWIGRSVVPLIAVAEICSWYAVVTTNYIGNVIEESLWALTFALVGGAAFLAREHLQGRAKGLMLLAAGFCAAYVGFMVTVDVPMYWTRFQADIETSRAFMGLWDGLADLNSRWVVTHDFAEWRTEMAWMGLYFTFAVWVSLALAHLPYAKIKR